MFGLGMPELVVILLVVVLLFGASKIPEIGAGLGKAIRGFKKGMQDPDVKSDSDPPGKKSA